MSKGKKSFIEESKECNDKNIDLDADLVLDLRHLNQIKEVFNVNFNHKWNRFIQTSVAPHLIESVDKFDNSYFRALLRWNQNQVKIGEVAFIPTDVALAVDSGLRRYVEVFAADQDRYFAVFTRAYQKLTGTTATSILRQ